MSPRINEIMDRKNLLSKAILALLEPERTTPTKVDKPPSDERLESTFAERGTDIAGEDCPECGDGAVRLLGDTELNIKGCYCKECKTAVKLE